MAGIITKIGNSKVFLDFADGEGSAIIKGRLWLWDFHEYCGPTFYFKNGNVRKSHPPKAVWDAFDKWFRAYRKACPVKRKKGNLKLN